MKNLTIESAKQFLKDNGFFVDNLWTVQDVQSKCECTNEQAQDVLLMAMTNESTMSEIWFAIDMALEIENLK